MQVTRAVDLELNVPVEFNNVFAYGQVNGLQDAILQLPINQNQKFQTEANVKVQCQCG